MSNAESDVKRIFYFNINYACNNECIFCYSHNTKLAQENEELKVEEMLEYLRKMKAGATDRIIINGGEPLLHTEINYILQSIQEFGCEILVYTNGRRAGKLANLKSIGNVRFIIPVHGCKGIHDRITRKTGSFDETIASLFSLQDQTNCDVDIKIIINSEMIKSKESFNHCLEAYDNIKFNGAIHLTRMANTKVSIRNGCKSIPNGVAADYTAKIFDFWKEKKRAIKIYDSCIKKISELRECHLQRYPKELRILFKDCHLEKSIQTFERKKQECEDCAYKLACYSAVDTYKVLEWRDNVFFENLE